MILIQKIKELLAIEKMNKGEIYDRIILFEENFEAIQLYTVKKEMSYSSMVARFTTNILYW